MAMDSDEMIDSGGGDSSSSSSRSSSSSAQSSKTSSKNTKVKKAIEDAGRQANQNSVQQLQDQARQAGERAASYKRGGTMRKTKANRGMAKLHRGEDIMAPRKKKSRMRGRRGGR